MSEEEPRIKVEHVVGFSDIHIWYSRVDKAVLIRLDTHRWNIDAEDDGQHLHISKKE